MVHPRRGLDVVSESQVEGIVKLAQELLVIRLGFVEEEEAPVEDAVPPAPDGDDELVVVNKSRPLICN